LLRERPRLRAEGGERALRDDADNLEFRIGEAVPPRLGPLADDPPFDLSGDVCATWRRELAGYDYVAIAPTPVSFSPMPKPPPDVFADPSATEVLHNGDTTVYHLSRPLDPATCPSA